MPFFAVKFSPDFYMCFIVQTYVQLFATLWTVVHQAALFMSFFKQEYWSGLPFYLPWDLPDPGVEPTSSVSPALQAGSLPTEAPEKPSESRSAMSDSL